MGFTIIGFSEEISENGAFTKINAVPDQSIKTSGTKFFVGKSNKLIGAVAFLGEKGKSARLISPSLRATNPFYLMPVNKSLYGGILKTFVTSVDFTNSAVTTDTIVEPLVSRLDPENVIELVENESLECETLTEVSTPEQHSVIVYLSNQEISPLKGNFYTINAKVSIPLEQGVWKFAEIEFPDELPIGNYKVVGARAIIPKAVAFRFVPVGSIVRPGGIPVADESAKDLFYARYGRLGEWFEFSPVQAPGIEVLGVDDVAEAEYDIYMDIIKA